MNLYLDQFSKVHNFEPTTEPRRYLVLATTARSGSHMLGHLLYSTGRLGFPLEYVNPANLRRWKDLLTTKDLDTTLDRLKRLRTTPNGVFSIKMHYPQFQQFNGLPHLERCFPGAVFVLLSRRALVKQAVSYAIAEQTGVWIDGQRGNGRSPTYNFDLIARCLNNIVVENAAWRYFLNATGRRFVELEFESMKENLADAVNSVFKLLGESPVNARGNLEPQTRPQTHSMTEDWVSRFVSQYGHSLSKIVEPRSLFS